MSALRAVANDDRDILDIVQDAQKEVRCVGAALALMGDGLVARGSRDEGNAVAHLGYQLDESASELDRALTQMLATNRAG